MQLYCKLIYLFSKCTYCFEILAIVVARTYFFIVVTKMKKLTPQHA